MSEATASEAAGLRRNPRLVCLFHALHMSLFPIAVIALFWQDHVGMSLQQIMLLQGLFGLSVALFEFPSGYLADRIGYRRTLLLASLVTVVGWAVYVRADSFATVLLAEAIVGVGLACVSGADTALLYESLVELEREDEFAQWSGYYRFWGQAAEGSAALTAGLLYTVWFRLPFVVEAAVWLVAAGVAWRLTEPRRRRPLTTSLAHVRGMVRHVFVEHPRLRAVVALAIALGLASFLPVWLIVLYAEDAGVPVTWMGPLWAVANYVVALGSLASHRLERRLGLLPALGLCLALVAVGYAGLGLSHALFGFAFYYVLTLMRGLNGPFLHHEEQRLIPSSDRAGFLSLRSLLFRLSFLALGPAVGAAIDRWGMHPVLLAAGAGFVVAGGAALLALARAPRAEPEQRARSE